GWFMEFTSNTKRRCPAPPRVEQKAFRPEAHSSRRSGRKAPTHVEDRTRTWPLKPGIARRASALSRSQAGTTRGSGSGSIMSSFVCTKTGSGSSQAVSDAEPAEAAAISQTRAARHVRHDGPVLRANHPAELSTGIIPIRIEYLLGETGRILRFP